MSLFLREYVVKRGENQACRGEDAKRPAERFRMSGKLAVLESFGQL